jgi:hypothetical protein
MIPNLSFGAVMNLHKILMKIAATVAFLGGTFSTHAAIDCVGLITNLSLQMGAEGTLTLSLQDGPSYTYLCDIASSGRNGVSPTVCRAMYATLLASKLSGKRILIRFNDYSSCGSVPSWGNAGSLGWTQVVVD